MCRCIYFCSVLNSFETKILPIRRPTCDLYVTVSICVISPLPGTSAVPRDRHIMLTYIRQFPGIWIDAFETRYISTPSYCDVLRGEHLGRCLYWAPSRGLPAPQYRNDCCRQYTTRWWPSHYGRHYSYYPVTAAFGRHPLSRICSGILA